MSGVILGAASGLAFGLFQAVNVRALRQLDDAYLSTFLQLVVAGTVCAAVCVASGELGLLWDASAWAIGAFLIAGALHFLLAWTLLNLSQHRIGASRTSPLIGTVPLWGVAIAAAVYGQRPGLAALGAIALTVTGALTVSSPAAMAGMRWRDSSFALGTAFLWALSPIFTVEGLQELDSPLLGVTIGLLASAAGLGLVLALGPGGRERARGVSRSGIALKVVAGCIIAFATWGRWEALDVTAIGIVLALNLLAVPSLLVLAPLVAGKHERTTLRIWLGSGLVVTGSLVLIVNG